MPEPVDMELAMAEAVAAAASVFTEHGLEEPAVVINVAFADGAMTYAFGSRVPDGHREMMAESLRASAEEATGAC